MDTSLLFRGLLIGFSIAAPVGPIGALCIRRTLANGRAAGLLSGLGAATADACYGCVAGFGLTFISGMLIRQQLWLKLIGGLFLCYLGVRTLLAHPAAHAANASGAGLLGAYTSTLLLTLTNPTTILSFVAVFAGLGLANAAGDYGQAALLVLGVFAGSALWWLLLSGGVSLLRARVTPAVLVWVNRASGAVIVLFGVGALASLLVG
ncbi:MAG: LysE family transporter [Kouleothrix sp.]|jgi:threonine/homoserine/homoserine lactone efflux protein|nr:LysE family transporter [Kouleothrix sp.]